MTKIGFNEIYPFATENVKGYFSNIGIKNKTVLTVGSSLDQAFNAYLFGAKNVTVLDINPHTENFYRIKKQAILKVPREELYRLLTNKEKLFSFLKDENITSTNFLVSKDVLSEDAVTSNNLYLQSDEEYLKLRQILKKKEPTFITGNIFEKQDLGEYDCIIISNILQYITTFFPKDDPYQILQQVLNNLKEHLTQNGILQLLYLYSYTMNDIRRNEHPIPIYRLKDVYETLKGESLDITWIEGALYAYNKYDQDAIITYQKKGR